MRVVIDPNVLVSAAITAGVADELFRRWHESRQYELIVCPMLLAELESVLPRERFRRWLSAEDAASFLRRLAAEAEHAPDPAAIEPVTPDPDDDYLVALALEAGADALVSGDPDLHAAEAEGLLVLTPREMLDRL